MKKKGKWFWLFIGSSVIAIVLFAWTVFSATTFIQYAGALEKTENAYNKLNKKYKKLKKENSDAVNELPGLFSDDDSTVSPIFLLLLGILVTLSNSNQAKRLLLLQLKTAPWDLLILTPEQKQLMLM